MPPHFSTIISETSACYMKQLSWILSKCVFFFFSALVKLLNKSIEGTADDDEEGVTPDTAIRSGLELLKVHH